MFIRTYDTKYIEIKDESVVFLVTNSNVKHQLEGSEYSDRRSQCEKAAKILNKKSLRDASLEELKGKFKYLKVYFKKN